MAGRRISASQKRVQGFRGAHAISTITSIATVNLILSRLLLSLLWGGMAFTSTNSAAVLWIDCCLEAVQAGARSE